jgi:DNA polymerase I-like protein with 3'-5' exonuclease and polymerase domains
VSDLVTTTELTGEQFLLLPTGRRYLPRTGPTFNVICTWKDVPNVIESARSSSIIAIDFETRGAEVSSDDFDIIGLGLAWDRGSVYFHWEDLRPHNRQLIAEFILGTQAQLIAHNIYFDGAVIRKLMGDHPQWRACTYALLSMLHNESPESRWGLKDAQVKLLGWETSNEGDLDRWLVTNGYYTGTKLKEETPEILAQKYEERKLRPDKGEMWRAPQDILGKYCILDAESTYLLYTEILSPTLDKFPGFKDFYHKELMHLILILVDQKLHGIEMDVEGLRGRRDYLGEIADRKHEEFMAHPLVAPHTQEIQDSMRRVLYEKAPAEYKIDGGISKNFLKWKEKVKLMEAGELPEYNFNLQSGPQLRELLYNRLKFPVKITTETGEASTAAKALRVMGDIGSILSERMDAVKSLSFIDKYLELLGTKRIIHPSFRCPGTVTGRLTSKEPNLQQVEKSKAMMSLFRARPGTVWIDLDFSALEPVVATEFSQDRNMLAIYGDGRPSNDIYCFVMAAVPGMGERARSIGYDPYNPTKESLARVKKEMKKERSICKTVTLACQYGAGVRKVHQSLEEQEIYLSYEEVEAIHSGYWSLFAGLKDFAKSLEYEWRRNKGYVLNGLGRPMAVPEDYRKDLLNRFVQSTGHDILVKYIYLLSEELYRMQVPWAPVIIDWHDSTAIEVPEEYRDAAIQAFNNSMDTLNVVVGGTIKLKGTPSWGYTLSDIKEPEI